MRKILSFVSILPLVACSYSFSNRVNPVVTEPSPGRLVLKIHSRDATSDGHMKRLLLESAAKTTIDRGAIYLRIEEIDLGPVSRVYERSSSRFDDPNAPRPDMEGVPDVQQVIDTVQPPVVTHIRDGSVTFSISHEPVRGGRVFEATRLLDDLRSGALPEL